jgi:hypothetical protein
MDIYFDMMGVGGNTVAWIEKHGDVFAIYGGL